MKLLTFTHIFGSRYLGGKIIIIIDTITQIKYKKTNATQETNQNLKDENKTNISEMKTEKE